MLKISPEIRKLYKIGSFLNTLTISLILIEINKVFID